MAKNNPPQTRNTEIDDLRAQLAEALRGKAELEARLQAREQKLSLAVANLSAEKAQRGLAEASRRESEDKYRWVYEVSLDAILLTTPEGSILAANPAACRMFGYTEAEFRHLGRTGVVDPSEPRLAAGLEERTRSGRFSGELTQVRKDGAKFPGGVSSAVFQAGDGSMRTCTIIRDNTEVRAAEETARHNLFLLNESQRMAHLGSWELDLAANRLTWSDEVYRLFGIQPREFAATYEAFLECVHPDDRAAVDAAYSGSLREGRDTYEIEHRLVQKDSGEVRTVLEKCVHVRDATGKVVRSVGMVHDITERKLAENALRHSEAKFRAVVENSWDGILMSDANAVISYRSPSYGRINGYDDAERVGHSGFETAHPDDLARIRQWWGNVVQRPGTHEVAQYRIRHQDGSWRWIETSVVNLLANPDVGAIVVASRDITESRRAEAALQESEASLAALIETIDGSIWSVDRNLRLWAHNNEFSRSARLGFGHEVARGDALLDEAPQSIRADWRGYYDRGLRGESFSIVTQTAPPLAPRYVEYHFNPIREPEGTVVGVTVFGKDITERKQAEETLRASADLNGAILRTAMDGFWIIDRDDRFVDVNDAYCRMSGYTRDELLQMQISDVEALETAADVKRHTRRIVERGSDRFESRQRRKDGRVIDVEVSVNYLPAADRRFVFVRDITLRKQAETAEREARILAEALRDTAAAINQSLDQETVLERILENVGRVVPHDTANIALVRQGMVQVAQCRGYPPDQVRPIRSLALPLTQVPNFRRMVEEGQPVIVADTSTSPEWVDLGTFTRWQRAYLGVPIRSEGQVIGLLNLDSATPGFFSAAHAERLQAFADQAGVALANARLYAAEREQVTELADLSARLRQELAERRQAEEALRRSETRYRTLFSEMMNGCALHEIVCDDAGAAVDYATLEVNRAYEDLLNMRREAVVGKRASEILPPEELQKWLGIFGPVALTGESTHYEMYSPLNQRYFEGVSFCPEKGHFAVIFTDVTERLRAQGILQESEQRLRATIDRTRAGYFRIGTDGRFQEVNAAWLRMHGYATPEEVVGQPFSMTQVEADLPAAQAIVGSVLAGIPVESSEFSRRCKDGSIGYHTFSTAPVMRDGQIVGLDGFLIDTTDRKLAENQVHRLNMELEQRIAERTAELRAANAELVHASRLKDEFLANMSHELRTPLASILGLSETLQMGISGPLTDKQAQMLNAIHQSGQHLLGVITDILDLSKVEAGKLELLLAPTAVSEVCEGSLQFVRQTAQKKHIPVMFSADPQVRLLLADARLLKQMLVNLLSNAVKFTPEGGQVGLEVAGDAERGEVRFTVWDTGIGISPEKQTLLFQPFVQVDGSLARRYEGVGLGLALTRRLAELHGGRVTVYSAGADQGSRFTLHLPWRHVEPRSGTVPEASAPPVPAAPLSRTPVILVADDNEASRMALGDFLETLPARVVIARDGQEALAQAEAVRPDLILMDIQMPGLDGLEVIRRLKAAPPTARVPVVALTALAMSGDREKCLAAGADAYVSKPTKLDQLAQLIRSLLGRTLVR